MSCPARSAARSLDRTSAAPAPRRAQTVRGAVAAFALVGVAASATAADLAVPGDHPTIQAAIDAAVDGDRVLVAPGTYLERLDIDGVAVRIVGTGDTAADVVIDAEHEPDGPAVRIAGVPSASGPVGLEHLTVRRGGWPSSTAGTVRIEDASPEIRGCRFVEGLGNVGTVAVVEGGSPRFVDCEMLDNTAPSNGALISVLGGTVRVEGGRMAGNDTASALLYASGGNLTVERVRIEQNLGTGFVLRVASGMSARVQSCILRQNEGAQPAIQVRPDGYADVLSSTWIGEEYPSFASISGWFVVRNSIVRGGGESPPIQIFGVGSANVSWSNVEGGWPGTGNLDVDPMFESAPGNLRLRPGSPCIDAGTYGAVFVGDLDVDGLDRIVDDRNVPNSGSGQFPFPDMGAHERQLDIRYVDDSAPAGGDGLSWATAFRDVQNAAEDAGPVPVAEIWIAAGTYRVDGGTGDRDRSLEMRSGLAIRGGFAGDETRREEADRRANLTLLDGDINQPTFSDNTQHVVRADGVDATGLLTGVTIQRGIANGAQRFGGGLFVTGGAPRIHGVTFRRNSTLGDGAAIAAIESDVDLRDVAVVNHNPTGSANSIVFLDGGEPSLANVLIASNDLNDGPALHVRNVEELRFRQVTIAGNRGGGTTAGAWFEDVFTRLSNCILWGNEPTTPPPGDEPWLGQLRVDGGSVDGGWTTVEGYVEEAVFPGGAECDGEDPRFLDPDGPDDIPANADDVWRLAPGSPAIDAGIVEEADGLELDLAGGPRRLDDPGTVDRGDGPAPVVDRGPYEFDGVTCLADVDGDGAVALGDLLSVLSAFGACSGAACPADLNADGVVALDDLLAVLSAWGPCPA